MARIKDTDNIEDDDIERVSNISKYGLFTTILLRIIKSKPFKLLAGGVFIVTSFLFVTPLFFNNSALKAEIEKQVSKSLNANFKINGEVEVAILPYPAIIGYDILLQNYSYEDKIYNLYAKSGRVRIAIFKFLGNSLIRDFTLSDAVLESRHNANQNLTIKNKLTEIINKFSQDLAISNSSSGVGVSSKLFSMNNFDLSKFNMANLPTIIIKNGELISYNIFNNLKTLQAVNLSAKISNKRITIAGQFNDEGIINEIKLLARFGAESLLELKSSALNLRISGQFTSRDKKIYNSDFIGKVEMEISELKSFYKTYLDNRNVVYEKLKLNNKPIKLTADLAVSDQEIAFNNLVIKSLLMNGKGDITVDVKSKIPDIDIDLDMANLDLENIWSGERVISDSASEEVKDLAMVDDNLGLTDEKLKPLVKPLDEKTELIDLDKTKKIKNFNLTAEVSVKKVSYLDGDLENLNLYATVSKNGEILIMPLVLNIPGEGMLRISGILENSNNEPKFIGKFDIGGKKLADIFKWLKIESQNLKVDNLREYISHAEIMLRPNSVRLNNFYFNLNNGDSEFLGEVRIDNSQKTTNIVNKFQISNFAVDDYFLTSEKNAYLSSGSLLKKLLWLNEISSDNDIDLSFANFNYKGEKFYDQSIKLRFGQGYFIIDNLNFKSDLTDLKTNLNVDIRDNNPKFEMKIIANKFHYESSQKSKAIDQFFALPSLEEFSGKIDLDLKDVMFDDLAVSNAKMSGKLKNGNVDLSYFNCDLYGGKFDYKGLIGIKIDKTVNGNISFKDVALDKLLSDLTGIKTIKGVANITANITSSASNKTDFLKEMDSEIKFNANAPNIVGYGLGDLIRKMFLPQTYQEELQQPEKIIINDNAQTVLKQASGNISFSKSGGGKFKINIAAPALNGILSGKIDIASNKIDGLANMIFLTGDRQKQIPINIATSFKGNMNEISQNTNLDQVRQYLRLPPINKAPASVENDNLFKENASRFEVQDAPANDFQNNPFKEPTQIKAE